MADRALLVGINAYPSQPLNGCLNDVQDAANFLVAKCGFDTESIRLLVDDRATTEGIRERLAWLVDRAAPGDRLYFHYSGHGTQFPLRNQSGEVYAVHGAICPVDFDWTEKHALLDVELRKIIDSVPDGVDFLFISDSCNSGDLTRAFRQYRPRFYVPPVDLQWRLRTAAVKGIKPTEITHDKCALISGCRADQESADAVFAGRYNGALTYYLLRALQEPQGLGTPLRSLVDSLGVTLKAAQYDQEPQLRGPGPRQAQAFFMQTSIGLPTQSPPQRRDLSEANTVANMPFAALRFDKSGHLSSNPLSGFTSGLTDLIVISHGWKTDEESAQTLYETLLTNIFAGGPIDGAKRFGVAGVFWPSTAFRGMVDMPIAGGRAVAPPSGADLDQNALWDAVNQFEIAADARGQLGASVNAYLNAPSSDAACRELMASLLTVTPPTRGFSIDGELAAERATLAIDRAAAILDELRHGQTLSLSPSLSRALDRQTNFQPAGLSGPRSAVGRLLEQLTFYEMKSRAGAVGERLGSVHIPGHVEDGIQLHFIGHSFGARLVTAAAHATSSGAKLRTLALLQGAFSHNALSPGFDGHKVGVFANTHRKVSGASIISHTHNDSAVTLAYALANRLSNDRTRAIGDANDPFGAMGANGAQHLAGQDTPVSLSMSVAATYPLVAGRVHNVLSDACISDHMDVTNANVALLVRSALALA